MPNKLRIHRDVVALEAFAVSDVTAYFKDVFPSIAGAFSDFVSRFKAPGPNIALSPKYRNFQHDMLKHAYLDVAPITAYVPEGLAVGYLDYAERLLAAVQHSVKIMDVMGPYSVYLSQLITNKDALVSTKGSDVENKILQRERDDLNDNLGECFRKGSTKAEASIGDVVRRNAEWTDVFAMCDDMSALLAKVDRKALMKKVNECSEHLAIILKLLRDKDIEKVANQTVINLADGAYQMAAELEFFAVVYFKVEVFTNCVNKTIDHFRAVNAR